MNVVATGLLALLLTAGSLPAFATEEVADPIAAIANAANTPEKSGYLDQARELVMHALGLIGVNYKFGGNNPKAGFDCSGLVSHVFREVTGRLLPRDSQAMSKVGDKVEKTSLQPGDLVFFNTRRRPNSHVGIYIGEERFVHASTYGRDVEISNMHDRYWQKSYNGARRVSF